MGRVSLHLFTNIYPFKGGEPFLEAEIPFLLKKVKNIEVFPQYPDNKQKPVLPNGIYLSEFKFQSPVQAGNLLKRNWKLAVKWWGTEFIRSPHRWKYITEFKWNFNRFLGLLDTACRLKDHYNSEKDNVFYTYWFNEWGTILALAKDLGLKGRFVTRAHGYDFDEAQQGRGYHPFRYTEIQKFDAVYQVSEYGLNYIKRQFPRAENLFLSRLGTPDYGMGPVGSGDIYQIVSCSNFVPLKRIPLIAQSLKELEVKFHWTHFGDGPERPEVEKQVLEILPADNFTFKGYLSNSELMEYYRQHPVDLFVNMSILEGIPVSMMEAISFGIPVVGFDLCGIPEVVGENTGKLLGVHLTPSDTAKEIATLINFKSRNQKVRMKIRSFWQRKYQAALNYEMFSNLIAE